MVNEVKWQIAYYKNRRGNSPVYEFIERLNVAAQGKMAAAFALLEEYGYRTGLPHAKRIVGTPLWELRLLGNDSLRFLYIFKGRSIIILHGFKKKKQRIDKREIKMALVRLDETYV